jgi:hypothetical protein
MLVRAGVSYVCVLVHVFVSGAGVQRAALSLCACGDATDRSDATARLVERTY